MTVKENGINISLDVCRQEAEFPLSSAEGSFQGLFPLVPSRVEYPLSKLSAGAL